MPNELVLPEGALRLKKYKRPPKREVYSLPLMTDSPRGPGVYGTIYQDAEGYIVLDFRYYSHDKKGELVPNVRGVVLAGMGLYQLDQLVSHAKTIAKEKGLKYDDL